MNKTKLKKKISFLLGLSFFITILFILGMGVILSTMYSIERYYLELGKPISEFYILFIFVFILIFIIGLSFELKKELS